jgi:hypothetical protein
MNVGATAGTSTPLTLRSGPVGEPASEDAPLPAPRIAAAVSIMSRIDSPRRRNVWDDGGDAAANGDGAASVDTDAGRSPPEPEPELGSAASTISGTGAGANPVVEVATPPGLATAAAAAAAAAADAAAAWADMGVTEAGSCAMSMAWTAKGESPADAGSNTCRRGIGRTGERASVAGAAPSADAAATAPAPPRGELSPACFGDVGPARLGDVGVPAAPKCAVAGLGTAVEAPTGSDCTWTSICGRSAGGDGEKDGVGDAAEPADAGGAGGADRCSCCADCCDR